MWADQTLWEVNISDNSLSKYISFSHRAEVQQNMIINTTGVIIATVIRINNIMNIQKFKRARTCTVLIATKRTCGEVQSTAAFTGHLKR